MKLLDTTFLIHYWMGRKEVKKYLEDNEEEEFVTSTLNIKEVAVGRELQGKLNPIEIRSKFNWVDVIPFQFEHSCLAAELESVLHQDETVNQDEINSLMGDILIAAVALEQGATVVTKNESDFRQFDGVRVESY